MDEKETEVSYNEAKDFLEQVKDIIHEAMKQKKKVVFASEDLLILEFSEDQHVVYEVLNRQQQIFASRLVYIGEKAVRASYLLNLINKEEIKLDPYTQRNR